MNPVSFLYDNFAANFFDRTSDDFNDAITALNSSYSFKSRTTEKQVDRKLTSGQRLLITGNGIYSTVEFTSEKISYTLLPALKTIDHIKAISIKPPFIMLEFSKRNFNPSKLQITYDLKHVAVCNHNEIKIQNWSEQ